MELPGSMESDMNAMRVGEMPEGTRLDAELEEGMRRQFVEAGSNWSGCLKYSSKRAPLSKKELDRYMGMMMRFEQEFFEAGIALEKLGLELKDWGPLFDQAFPNFKGGYRDGRFFKKIMDA